MYGRTRLLQCGTIINLAYRQFVFNVTGPTGKYIRYHYMSVRLLFRLKSSHDQTTSLTVGLFICFCIYLFTTHVYKSIICLLIGAYRRVLPPSCVTSTIRRKWPAAEGEGYTFFKKPKTSKGTILKWFYDSGLVTEEAAANINDDDDNNENDE